MPQSEAADRVPHGPAPAAEATRPDHVAARGPAPVRPASPEPASPEPAGPELAGAASTGAASTGAESTGAGAVRSESARNGPSCSEAAGLDAAEAAESGSAVVATWPATSRTRIPASVLYVNVRPENTSP